MSRFGNGNALKVHHYGPFGEQIAIQAGGALPPFPAGSTESPYKYGGKEWNTTTSTYDFEARQMAPAFHRFTSMDPLCEKYYSISPYAYCANNPVNLVDPRGKDLGDYYSYWGYYVGSDGHDDNKNYLVDDLTITNYLKIIQQPSSSEEIYQTLSTNAEEVDGLIVITRVEKNEEHTQGEFEAIGENGFSGYTMERPGPPTTIPNQKKPIPIGYYDTEPLKKSFAGGFAFRVSNREVPKTRSIYGHIGNTPQDSSGCILFGLDKSTDNSSIMKSRPAMENFRTFYSGKTTIKMIIR